jgi:TRAP-type C4-dicarboxylate transport system permease small subunit
MAFQQAIIGIENGIKPIKTILLVISAATLALMMFLTAVDVAMRYVFNSPIPGALELVEYMMALIVPFALAVAAYNKAHIGVDLIMERLPQKVQLYTGFLTNLLTSIFFGIIAWQSIFMVGEEFHSGVTSAVLLIPQYPFVASLAVAFVLLTLITLLHSLDSLAKVITQWTHS